MEENFKTSATELSEPGGKGASAPAVQYATDSASPAGVTEPVKGEIKKIDAMATSQQNEHSDPAGK